MKSFIWRAAATAGIIIAIGCSDRSTSSTEPTTTGTPGPYAGLALGNQKSGFGFNGTLGGSNGTVSLTGGGSFQFTTASNIPDTDTRIASGGGFRCVEGVVSGPLAGCATGEGVRWDAVQLLVSSNFRCSGADAVKVGFTGPTTVVMLADFYRAGDGNEESFRAPMIVSEFDIAPDVEGVQNLWVQGVGCGSAVVNFSNTAL